MGTTRIRSRILQFFSNDLLIGLNEICRSSVVSDNNLKVSAMINLMNQHELDFVELGPGTNRLAILIDNYVFKIALDKWGVQDNINEFSISQELQPYVVKTYETNDLISVCEYVTVISREEFEEQKDDIRRVLSVLADSYLLGDVGTVGKNFCNWGYRDNGELVILDFAYIYRVNGDELLCSKDQALLEYDQNFHNLVCPVCAKKYTFMDIRRKIPMEVERQENMIAKEIAYKLKTPVQEFNDGYKDEESLYNKKETKKEETRMGKKFHYDDEYVSPEDQQDSYLELLKELQGSPTTVLTPDEKVVVGNTEEDFSNTQVIDIQKETPNDTTRIRVFHHGKQSAPDSVAEVIEATAGLVREAAEEIQEAQEQLDERDEYDRLMDEIESEGGLVSSETTIVIGDGDDTIVKTTEITYGVNQNETDQTIEVKLEDPQLGVYRQSNQEGYVIADDQQIVIGSEVQVSDNITVESRVTIQNDDEDEAVRKIREELMNAEERRLQELASPYAYLENDNTYRKGGKSEWE